MAADDDALDVRKVLDGDVEAFGGIVRRWQGPLVNLAFRFCRDRDGAEEMAQDAFVKAFRSLAGWRGEGRFSTWLFAVALNLYRSRMRRGSLPLAGVADVETLAGEDRDAERVEREERARWVRRAVSSLPPKYREAIVLFYLNEMDLREAARNLGLPEGTLKARLHRGRELLRRKMSRPGYGTGEA